MTSLLALPEDDLPGINEIAELAGVSRQAVANWRARFPDFPQPVADLKAGPIFRARQIQGWLRRRKFPMARVVSLINLKGGVAKTTTTVALAETLASHFGKRVPVVDPEPQTNDKAFDPEKTLPRKVSDVQGAEKVDLLPSSLIS